VTKKSKLEYQQDEHKVHLMVYYLIWCPNQNYLDAQKGVSYG